MKKYIFLFAGFCLLLGADFTGRKTFAQEVSLAPTNAVAEFYACPMHADVTANKPGTCSKCGMALTRTADAITDEFVIRTETLPKQIKPGQKTTLRFAIFHPKTGAQVKQFNIQHEKLFHLFVVSSDFKHFDHIHPELQKDGSFTVVAVLPQAGMYHLYCDIFPAGGTAHVVHQNLVTSGFKGDAATLQARLTPDQTFTKTVEGTRIEWQFAPERPLAGQPALLRYQLTDVKTGQAVQDLQPYLGAWGHTLILSADGDEFLHSHPLEAPASQSAPSTIYFETFFPRPGQYRIWSQFQRHHQLLTVAYTITVKEVN
jgi:hypothetical protein